MKHPPLSVEFIQSRLSVDLMTGTVTWIDATKHHRRLNGLVAGSARKDRGGKFYWVIKLNGIQYLRSQIVFTLKTGAWPMLQVDHHNGDSLDDRADNLRAATQTQNSWNHKSRSKASNLPMGVRALGGRFQARIAVNKRTHYLGTFDSPGAASDAYCAARVVHFGEFA